MAQREGISGRHAVLQALRSGRVVHSVLITRESGDDPRLKEIREAAGARHVGVQYAGEAEVVRMAGSAAQGVAAMVAPLENYTVKGLLDDAASRGMEAFLVAADGIEDPQNLGAIARSALLAGCTGMLVPERGTAVLGSGASKAAAGAFSQLPVARVSSLGPALASLRREGVYLVGADANGGKLPWSLRLTGPVCFVLGSEANGLSKQVQEQLDAKACIPTPGGDLSMNVSAAAAVLLFERVRQSAK